MNIEAPKKILVIGSKNHPLADFSISWDEIVKKPYLGDYHVVIVVVPTLVKKYSENRFFVKFKEIREEINDVIWGNTEIVCITAPKRYIDKVYNKLTGKEYSSVTNYDWCPIKLNLKQVEGESFEEKPQGNYFDFVEKWTHYLEEIEENQYLYQPRKRGYFCVKMTSILKNLAQKPIAFEIKIVEYNIKVEYNIRYLHGERRKITDKISSNALKFLPPPTKITIDDGVNYLIQEIKGIKSKETILPKWTEKIPIIGEQEICKEIKEKEKLIKQLQQKLKEKESELAQKRRYKRLLTTDGEELEKVVEECLSFLGIKVKNPPKYKEDRIIIDPSTNSEIPVEITGVKYSIPEVKLNQLIGRLSDAKRIEKIKCQNKGLLIGNHYKDIPLDGSLKGRRKPFEKEVIEKAKVSKIGLLSTVELFKAVNAKLAGKDTKNFVKAIFNTPGEIFFKEL